MRLLFDHNFRESIRLGLIRRMPDLDHVTARERFLDQFNDPDLLAWAAAENCVIVSHDVQTLIGFALDRVRAGLPMPGLIVCTLHAPIGVILTDLELMISATTASEMDGQVCHIPIR